jgi:hypothetical protein
MLASGSHFPAPDNINATKVAITGDIDARIARRWRPAAIRVNGHVAPHRRTVTLRHVAARIADH